jgi:hypothetical protein
MVGWCEELHVTCKIIIGSAKKFDCVATQRIPYMCEVVLSVDSFEGKESLHILTQ